jgi:hypothetical protein
MISQTFNVSAWTPAGSMSYFTHLFPKGIEEQCKDTKQDNMKVEK